MVPVSSRGPGEAPYFMQSINEVQVDIFLDQIKQSERRSKHRTNKRYRIKSQRERERTNQ
uniref:Uncharacterized protein n=1 Tax=Picea glauca TaxID=3330 RepID=A0A101LY77_PICGL|nr:hypothetical protein ABT39_MTgene5735 [Picea glauca]